MTMQEKTPAEYSNVALRVLSRIEHWGDRLPDPTALFFYLCLIIIAISTVASWFNLGAIHPVTEETLLAKSLLSSQGISYIFTDSVKNYMNFAPLGPVLVAMLGIGLADRSGLLTHLIEGVVARAPRALLSYSVVFGGILSNLAADAGYVVYIPLCALVFKAYGRHPLAGIAAAFAGVSGGYSANIVIGPVDVIMSGLTQAAGQMIDSTLQVPATNNYLFLMVSTFLISLIGGWITDVWVEPYLKRTQKQTGFDAQNISRETTAKQTAESLNTARDALRRAAGGIFVFFLLSLWLWCYYLPSELDSGQPPLLSGLVLFISMGFAIGGIIYGKTLGRFRQSKDWVQALVQTFEALAGYLVLMFFAAQFVAWFNWSQLGPILAIRGAQWVSQADVPPLLLILSVLTLTCLLNLFIGSASAKWALLAPIFVPLLMLSGVPPEWTQIAYRIGDSSTNIITPLMPYFALVLAFAQQHDRHLKIGRLMALMIPYALSFLFFWTLLLIAWFFADFPLGL